MNVVAMQTPTLPNDLRDELRARVDRDGAEAVSNALGIPISTLARCMAGLGVRRGTVALVRLGLAETPRPAA